MIIGNLITGVRRGSKRGIVIGKGNGSGGGTFVPLPVHSRIAVLADGILSGQNSASGPACGLYHAMEFINGRLKPCIGFDIGASSGETFASMRARIPQLIGQKPDVVVIHGSHNDFNNTYTHTVNPAWSSTWTTVDDYNAKFQAIINDIKTGLPNCIIVIITTVPSTTAAANETAGNRDIIWNYQRALHDGKKIFVCDLGGTGASPGYNPATFNHDGTHPNYLGGVYIGRTKLGPLLDTLVAPATIDELLNTRTAFGEFGADLYTLNEYQFAFTTGGQLAGTIAPTGQYADGKRITNNLTNGTSVSVVCSRDTTNAAAIQYSLITGTPAAANTVVEDEATSPTSTVTLGISSAVIGKYYELILLRSFDDGAGGAADVRSFAAAVGSFGSWNVAASNANASQDYDFAFSQVVRTAPKCVYQNNPALISGNLNVNPAITSRLSNIAQQTRLGRSRQILREVERTAYGIPTLIENYVTGASDRLRIMGTVGGTNALIASPGQIAGGGLSFSPEWRLNGVLVSSTWVYTQTTPAPGDVIEFRPNPSNSVGTNNSIAVSVTVP